MTLGIGLRKGPRGVRFLISEVPLSFPKVVDVVVVVVVVWKEVNTVNHLPDGVALVNLTSASLRYASVLRYRFWGNESHFTNLWHY